MCIEKVDIWLGRKCISAALVNSYLRQFSLVYTNSEVVGGKLYYQQEENRIKQKYNF